MKSILSIAAIVALVFSNTMPGFAGPNATVNVTVTIEKALSISVVTVPVGPITFGTLGISEIKVADGRAETTNDGSGVAETIKVDVTDPTGWTQGTPAKNVYRMTFQFADTKPAATDANWKLPANVAETLTHEAMKKLWVKLETPTATDVTTEQIIALTISAE